MVTIVAIMMMLMMMSFEHIAGLVLAMIFMALGVLGSILPGLPGPPVILATALLHRWYFGAESSAGNLALVALLLLTLVATLLDYLAGVYGAKKLGATWKGLVGAALGGLIGILGGIPGIIIGPLIGATLLEWLAGRDFRESTKAGLGAMLGTLGGAVGKTACSIAMTLLFLLSVLFGR